MTPDKSSLCSMYNSFVNIVKPAYRLPAVANPSQLPPPTKVRGSDGKVTPAMAAGLTKKFMTLEDIANLVVEEAPKKRGPYKKRQTI
jgi:hypothetical protein